MKVAVAGLANNCHRTLSDLTASIFPPLREAGCNVAGFFVCPPGSEEERCLRPFGTTVPDPAALQGVPRYQKMSRLRNAYLDAIARSGFDPDVLLVVDLDVLRFDSWAGLGRLLRSDQWDAVSVLGLAWHPRVKDWHVGPVLSYNNENFVYYDTLAFESVDGARSLWKVGGRWYPHGRIPPDVRLVQAPPVVATEAWTRVNSAFGPATFYRWSRVRDFRFDDGTGQCEHHDLHRWLRMRGGNLFIAHDLVALYDCPEARRPPTIHMVYSFYEPKDVSTQRRMSRAQATWQREAARTEEWDLIAFKESDAVRDSRTIGDTGMPFLHDMFTKALGRARTGSDVVAISNADVSFVSGLTEDVIAAVRRHGAAYCHRWDYTERNFPTGAIRREQIFRTAKWYPGSDFFAFSPNWAREHLPSFPDMVLGREYWDLIMRLLMRRTGGQEIHGGIYHQRHPSFWEQPGIRETNPGNLHNKLLATEWIERFGGAWNDWDRPPTFK